MRGRCFEMFSRDRGIRDSGSTVEEKKRVLHISMFERVKLKNQLGNQRRSLFLTLSASEDHDYGQGVLDLPWRVPSSDVRNQLWCVVSSHSLYCMPRSMYYGWLTLKCFSFFQVLAAAHAGGLHTRFLHALSKRFEWESDLTSVSFSIGNKRLK